jgi:membrane-bound lytic murein transglycosylase A
MTRLQSPTEKRLSAQKDARGFRQAFVMAGWCLLMAWLAGCAVTPKIKAPQIAMQPVAASAYPRFCDDMGYDNLMQCLSQSLVYLRKQPGDRLFRYGPDPYSAKQLIDSLETFTAFLKTRPSCSALNKFIKANYRLYRSEGRASDGRMLFTGYYEPVLIASRVKTPFYSVPILGAPKDLVSIDLSAFASKFRGDRIVGRWTGKTVVPYYSRKEIVQEGRLEGRAPVLAWLHDPLDLFFLQVQGSGKVYLTDGGSLNIHYRCENGLAYRSVGKRLIDQGRIPKSEMSMQRIRSYLHEHPEAVSETLNYNPSYVFFQTESAGPKGAINLVLTPGRSLAADRRVFPMAALAYIQTEKPVIDGNGAIDRWTPFGRFVLVQDSGGAIRGAGRADLFWGSGPYAEIAAGHLQHPGALYFLVLKR